MSKFKKIGYVSLGVVLGASLTVSVPALAATVKTIQAKINSSVSVVVDGKKMSALPINYQNLNYLPVGEIGRALDADVSFDKTKNVISIKSKDDKVTSSSNVNTANTTNSGITSNGGSTNQSVKRASLNKEYKVGDLIEFTDATFKVVDASKPKDFNDMVNEITLTVELEIEKVPSGLRHVNTADFLEYDSQFESELGLRISYHTVDGEKLPLNQKIQAKIIVYVTKGDTLKQVKIMNPIDFWGYDSDRYKNPERTVINL
ncbi:stalk domain-containing protein [Paenibacillus amylolyticus]|uniref:stalk domain-containing protein n=1 Tax=Paenibacillus amylolyticus TaxID=1451 RepID=UPI003393B61D